MIKRYAAEAAEMDTTFEAGLQVDVLPSNEMTSAMTTSTDMTSTSETNCLSMDLLGNIH